MVGHVREPVASSAVAGGGSGLIGQDRARKEGTHGTTQADSKRLSMVLIALQAFSVDATCYNHHVFSTLVICHQ